MQPFRRSDDDACADDAEGDHPPERRAGMIDRRGILRGAAGLVPIAAGLAGFGWAAAPSDAEAASSNPPYPFAKRRVTRMDGDYLWRKGVSADQWVSGQVGGGRILAAWGDGFGFTPSGKKGFIGVTEISGSVGSPRGVDLWRNTSVPLKPCAIIGHTGNLYMFAVSDRDGRDGSYLLRGANGGRRFATPQGPILSRSRHGLVVVGSYDPAPGRANGTMGIYLSTDGNLKTAKLYDGNRNRAIYLAHANNSTIDNFNQWKWRAGAKRNPVFYDSNGSGKHFQVSWCATTNSYIAVKTHQRAGLGIFSSPNAFGPWSTLWYGDLIKDAGAVFSAKAISMWSTRGTIAIMWSGSPTTNARTNHDAVHLTRFRYG